MNVGIINTTGVQPELPVLEIDGLCTTELLRRSNTNLVLRLCFTQAGDSEGDRVILRLADLLGDLDLLILTVRLRFLEVCESASDGERRRRSLTGLLELLGDR